jgi:hypothetical protein
MAEGNDRIFVPVHICRECGDVTERKDVTPTSLISGLIACRSCGHESQLNLEIRGTDEKRPPTRETSPRE